MDSKVKIVAESFDRTLKMSHQGINQYMKLPAYITSSPMYVKYQMIRNDSETDSGNPQIYEFLKPSSEMKFVDLGCCLNLINRGYDKWESLYYGVDISKEVMRDLNMFIQSRGITVGGLVLCDMENTPFEESSFDIGTCIGSLEYYSQKKIESIICEFYRIIKPNGRIVIDIPNSFSEEGYISRLVEEYLGRKDDFDMSEVEFEKLIEKYFFIRGKEKIDTVVYYLEKKNNLTRL